MMRVVPLGLGYVAAALKSAGHEVCLLDLGAWRDPESALESTLSDFRPDVIGLSLRNLDADPDRSNFAKVSRQIEACRRFVPNRRIVMGGSAFTLFPEPLMRYFGLSLGVVGEGEETAPRLLRAMEHGGDLRGLPGVAVMAEGVFSLAPPQRIADFGSLPVPMRNLTGLEPTAVINLQGRRGCSMACTYCVERCLGGRSVRLREPELVVDEVEALARDFPGTELFFVDTVFNMPTDHAIAVCEGMVRRDLKARWTCYLNPRDATEELLDSLARAGCHTAYVGMESGSDEMLHRYAKGFSVQEAVHAAEGAHRRDIAVFISLIWGGPGECERTVRETIGVMRRLSFSQVGSVQGVTIYPGTPFHAWAKRRGIVPPDEDLFQPHHYLSPECRGLDIERMMEEAGVKGAFVANVR